MSSSDDSRRDWSDVRFRCRDSFCGKVVCKVCHVSSQSLSPSRYRAPRCNPSGSFDPRHSACQGPAPTLKLVTLWQVAMDACDCGQIHALFSAPSIITHGFFCLKLPPASFYFCCLSGLGTTPADLGTRGNEDMNVHWHCPSLIICRTIARVRPQSHVTERLKYQTL